ncbi:cation channel sperm-associated auxiliary subunit epsilon-like isoform X2 [Clavelina lepadiformis]|uniref:cation channel sperm-associated auxiliary subunit epsilon-like isoform X2 n=1 Tax=Clavelina lepadiformis TaxID=159417 RepID=UPI0040432A87
MQPLVVNVYVFHSNNQCENKMLYLFLLSQVLSFALIASATWRFSPQGLPPFHFLDLDQGIKYFWPSADNLHIYGIDQNNFNWTIPDDCQSQDLDNGIILSCKRNGKYQIGIDQASCTNCGQDGVAVIRVEEAPDCYLWSIMPVQKGINQKLQIYVVPRRNWKQAIESRTSSIYTRIFHAHGEQPILKTVANTEFTIVSTEYNTSSDMWEIEVPSDELRWSAYVKVSSLHVSPVLGCSIFTTFVFIKETQKMLAPTPPEPVILLKGENDMIGRIYYHSCFPHRAVMITQDRVLFTDDEFSSTNNLTISSQLSQNHGNTISDVAFTVSDLIILIQGKVFGMTLLEGRMRFQMIVINNTNDELVGVTGMPVCFMSPNLTNPITWENNLILAWSTDYVYLNDGVGIFNSSKWKRLSFNQQFPGALIRKVKLSNTPGTLALTINHQGWLKLLLCRLLESSQLNCSEVNLPIQLSTDVQEMEFLNTAKSSLILWNNRHVSYIYDTGRVSGMFDDVTSVKRLILSHDRTAWLVQTGDNLLYYGSGKCTNATRLRLVDESTSRNFTYKFRQIDKVPLRISWTHETVTVEVYPLYKEVYSALQNNSKHSEFCDYTHYQSNLYSIGGNVVNLESIDDQIMVNFTLVHPASTDVRINLIENVNNLVMTSQMRTSLTSLKVPGRPLLRVQSIQAILSGTCKKSNASCPTGIALVEAEAITDDGMAACFLPVSQVLYVNVTCPVGLHIRIKNDSVSGCNPIFSGHDCSFTITEDETFYPTIDLYRFNEYLYTLEDDVKFVETNGRTGFEMHNKNLMLKACYLCSQFKEVNSTSEMILQTARSACPCELAQYDPSRWTGNISFEYADSAPSGAPNDFVFNVQVLGNSFCDLRMSFTVRLIPEPLVPFMLWEIVVVIIFIVITLVALAISYRNYIIYVKATKEKLS